MSRHSPLPWRVGALTGRDDVERMVISGDYYVATCAFAPGDRDADGVEPYTPEANAAFIVHAVNCHDDLLAALKGLEQFTNPEGCGPSCEPLCLFCAATAAIANAEGQ